MGDEHGSNGVADRILAEVLDLGTRMGRLEGEMSGCVQHLAGIDRRLELGSSQMHQYGGRLEQHGTMLNQLQTQVEVLTVEARQRKRECSAEFKRLGGRIEDTGVHVIEQRGAWVMVKKWGLVVVIVGGVMAIGAGLEKCKPMAARGGAADARR